MQTQTLPIQVSSASPAPQRTNASAPSDGAQFSQALSREIDQRQHSPAPAAAAAKSQAAPAQAAGAQVQAKPAGSKSATANADGSTDNAKDDAADAAAASPVADMLAFVASFIQPAAVTTAPSSDPLAAAAPLAASAALQGTELPVRSDKELKADADAALLAADGKTPTLQIAGDVKGLAFKEVAQAADGAARFAMKALGGAAAPDAKPKDAATALPQSIPGTEKPRADSTPALAAAAAQKPDADGALAPAASVNARAEPALAPAVVPADAAPLRAREGAADVAALKEPAAAAPVQQASLAMAQAVNGAPTDRIAARVGTPGWDNQVGQKIIWMVAGKEQSASLTLNPPDMGPMQVVLSVTNDKATVTFSAAQPEVRQALENAMPKLREMMSENGIALGNATVNAGMPDQRQAQQGEQPRSQGGATRFGGAGAEAPRAAAAPRARPGTGTGLVDTFA